MSRSLDAEFACRGFDAAVWQRDQDHLNRWPFAREIYGVAVSGHKDWSVRVGVYGEWGTGKTSVLNFVEAFARRSDHIIIRFNPWQYSDSRDLWHDFVQSLDRELQEASPGRKPYDWRRLKKPGFAVMRWLGRHSDRIRGAVDDKRVTLPLLGIELLRDFVLSSRKDLEKLLRGATKRRILILIDDLDRTTSEIVPEMLFAVKEIMDVPGVAFVCAFDPAVVGKVLRFRHRGFGDGLKFLEKIIDYPRWLPPPTAEGLAKLAIADAKRCCEYVPEQVIRDAVPLLPPNPRAVRQFIRLLALLRPQIERHHEDELRWPLILSANVLKIRYPRLAHALLKDETFWENTKRITIMARGRSQDEELRKAIEGHVDSIAAKQGVPLELDEREEIFTVMRRLCSVEHVLLGLDQEDLAYQMNIAESPHAVTRKEFDRFFEAWVGDQTSQTGQAWIADHAKTVERPDLDVYHEIFDATLRGFAETLRQADAVRTQAEKDQLVEKAKLLIALLEILVFDLGQLDQREKSIGENELGRLLEVIPSIAASTSPSHSGFRPRSEALLEKMAERWTPDVTPLIKAICPYGYAGPSPFDGQISRALQQRLSAIALPKLAKQTIDGFRQPDFVQRVFRRDRDTHESLCLLLTPDGPMWGQLRQETLLVFAEAKDNRAVQENAFELLHWFDYMLREWEQRGDTANVKKLLSEKEILDAIWSAATANPLSPGGTAGLYSFVQRLKTLDISVELPPWWDQSLRAIGLPKEPPPAPGLPAVGADGSASVDKS